MSRPIAIWVQKMFEHAFKKQWFETYWAIDLHGVVIQPNYTKTPQKVIYYPYVKETLQIMSARPDIIMFTYTASYPEQLHGYLSQFEMDNIHFNFINENPDISEQKGHFGAFDKKPYYNVVFEDKAGFDPFLDWKPLFKLFTSYEKIKYKPDPSWDPKF